jgi:hypothetical protein
VSGRVEQTEQAIQQTMMILPYFHDEVPVLGLRDSRRNVPNGRSLQDAWIANVTWNLDCLLLYERKVLIG